MDSPAHRKTTLNMPLLVSPLRANFSPLGTELFSPLKLDHDISSSSITIQDEDDQVIETIPVERHNTLQDTNTIPTPHAEENYEEEEEALSDTDCESQASLSAPSTPSTPEPLITLTPSHLSHLNALFETMSPQEILRTCTLIFPNLYQTTAFGLTGLVTLDMLHKLSSSSSSPTTPQKQQPEIIFINTLHHFPQTLDLLPRLEKHYNNNNNNNTTNNGRPLPLKIHTYKPHNCDTDKDFAALHGDSLWTTDSERYDFLAKVEPQARAERELNVAAVLTGRRRSQGGDRALLPIIEIVPDTGMVKINPLAKWSWEQVKGYIDAHKVPYNELLDLGYRSVGDWHSTEPVGDGEGEREGRWKSAGKGKTECGLHLGRGRYAEFLREVAEKEEREKRDKEGLSRPEGKESQEVEDMRLEEKMDGVEVWKMDVKSAEASTHNEKTTEMVDMADLHERSGKRVGFDCWGNVF